MDAPSDDQGSMTPDSSSRLDGAGAATGGVALILRLEGLAALAGATLAYSFLDADWGLFALLFLVPDVTMLGYLVSRRVGAVTYNVGHTYLVPAALALAGHESGGGLPSALAAIWMAHIGFDRALGFGLKYREGFGATHLGGFGKRPV